MAAVLSVTAAGLLLPGVAVHGAADDAPAGVVAVDRASLVPAENANTVLLNQPISLVLSGLQAPLAPGTVSLSVVDRETGHALASPAVETTELDAFTLAVQSAPVAIVNGGRYGVTVTATDTEGSVGRFTWSFRHLEFDVAGTVASVQGSHGVQVTETTWAFLPEVRINPFTVRSGRTEHSGWGPVGQRVDLADAFVEYELVEGAALRVSDVFPDDRDVIVYKQFHKARGEDQGTVTHVEPDGEGPAHHRRPPAGYAIRGTPDGAE